jgi:hypothetical protein
VDPDTHASLGGDEQDDFQLTLEDVDQNAPETEEAVPTTQGVRTDSPEAAKTGQVGGEALTASAVLPGAASKKKKSREQLKVRFRP